MARTVTLSITGAFEPDDLYLLSAVLRIIDERHPDRSYALVIDDPGGTVLKGEQMVREMLAGTMSVERRDDGVSVGEQMLRDLIASLQAARPSVALQVLERLAEELRLARQP